MERVRFGVALRHSPCNPSASSLIMVLTTQLTTVTTVTTVASVTLTAVSLWCASGLVAMDLASLIPTSLSPWLLSLKPSVATPCIAVLLTTAPASHVMPAADEHLTRIFTSSLVHAYHRVQITGICTKIDYKLWQPFRGNLRFVLCQAAGWSLYALGCLLVLVDTISKLSIHGASLPGLSSVVAAIVVAGNAALVASLYLWPDRSWKAAEGRGAPWKGAEGRGAPRKVTEGRGSLWKAGRSVCAVITTCMLLGLLAQWTAAIQLMTTSMEPMTSPTEFMPTRVKPMATLVETVTDSLLPQAAAQCQQHASFFAGLLLIAALNRYQTPFTHPTHDSRVPSCRSAPRSPLSWFSLTGTLSMCPPRRNSTCLGASITSIRSSPTSASPPSSQATPPTSSARRTSKGRSTSRS